MVGKRPNHLSHKRLSKCSTVCLVEEQGYQLTPSGHRGTCVESLCYVSALLKKDVCVYAFAYSQWKRLLIVFPRRNSWRTMKSLHTKVEGNKRLGWTRTLRVPQSLQSSSSGWDHELAGARLSYDSRGIRKLKRSSVLQLHKLDWSTKSSHGFCCARPGKARVKALRTRKRLSIGNRTNLTPSRAPFY